MTTEKKSERIEVRVGFEEKGSFVDACDSQGDTPSSALRRFIRGYIRRADADVLSSAWRGTLQRRVWPIGLGITGLLSAAVLTAIWMRESSPVTPSLDTIFLSHDKDGDGALTLAEMKLSATGEPSNIILVLDLDASGTLSREEFQAKGRMVFQVEEVLGNSSDAPVPDTPVPDIRVSRAMTLVDFEFKSGEITVGIFENAIVNSGDLDRFVLWQGAGRPAVFQDRVDIRNDGNLTIMADEITVPSSMINDSGDPSMSLEE
ncbi:MAG: hypothetical protein ACSHX3_10055 [Litorimonas sp.]